MPLKVTRQLPNGPPAAVRVAPGSVLSRAVPISEMRDSWVKMLLYGGGGIGKTTLATKFPKPLLLLSYERTPSGGGRSARREPGVTWLRPGLPAGADPNDPTLIIKAEDVIADTERLGEELRGKCPFRTVVFDHVTVFQDWVLEKLTGKPLPAQLNFGAVSGDQYRDRAEMTKALLRPFADHSCNTVFVGKEKDHNPPKEEKISPKTGKLQPDMRPKFLRGMQPTSFVTVELGGGAAGWLQDACEYACRMYYAEEMQVVETRSNIQGQDTVHREVQSTGRWVRALRVAYHPNYFSRFRSDRPENLPESIEEPTWEKIEAAIEGRPQPKKSS